MMKKTISQASDLCNDVNGAYAVTPGAASGRGLFEVPQVVTKRNPQPTTTTNDTKSFNIQHIIGDGNCLFRSVSLYLYKTEKKHSQIRAETVQFVRRYWDYLKDYLDLSPTEPADPRSYCYKMRQDKTYGTSVEILAMSEIYKLTFNIYAEEKSIENSQYITNKKPTKISRSPHPQTINLLLTGKPDEGHYELLDPYIKQQPQQRNEDINIHQRSTLTKAIRSKEKKEAPTDQIKRIKWSTEEYKEILFCHFTVLEKTGTANINETFKLWKTRNPNSSHQLTANTMATQRRFILNNKKFSTEELEAIHTYVKETIGQEKLSETIKNIERTEDIQEVKKMSVEVNNLFSTAQLNSNIDNTLSEQSKHNIVGNIDITEMVRAISERIEKDNNMEILIQRNPLYKLNNSEKLKHQIAIGNKAIEKVLKQNPEKYKNITAINKLIYATASVIQEKTNPQATKTIKQKILASDEPPWKKRIHTQIDKLRKDLSHLEESVQPELSKKMQVCKQKLYKKYKIKHIRDHTKTVETLKQQISAKTCRIKRYTERSMHYKQNKMFSENTRKFYNLIIGNTYNVPLPPSKEDIKTYWKNIWEENTKHNETAPWILEEYEKTSNVKRMDWEHITEAEVKKAINGIANWKAPGIDGITNFWLKNLSSVHNNLKIAYNEMIKGNQSVPKWMTKGRTILIPKNKKTELAKNYRPITCLNNIYKVLTKIIAVRIQEHLTINNLFPAEQKGCIQNTYGCKDHLLTSKMLHKDCKERKKSMSIAWIDYQKAFDKLPHSWIIETLNIYRISPTILNFISKTMATWNIDLILKHEPNTLNQHQSHHQNSEIQNKILIENINIQNGIYQGDSLSPLLFCIALFPLSSRLNNTKMGYKCKNEKQLINHLLYIDDLKVIAKNEKELIELLKIVKEFSDDIKMKFGLEKCAKASFEKGTLISKEHIDLGDADNIRALDQLDVYKYLGIEEHDGIQHKRMKAKLKKEYYRRIRAVLRTELNAKNKITAITSLAVPVIYYSLDIIKWTKSEIRELDTQTRKLLTMYGALHPRADVDRLYIPRQEGGRGMTNLETTYNIVKVGLSNYLKLKEKDKYLGMVYRQSQQQDAMPTEDLNMNESETKTVRKIKQKMKEMIKADRTTKWKSKPLHGQIAKEAEKEIISQNQTWTWLIKSNVKAETESLITACQDQALATNYMKTKILKTGNDVKCRLCRSFSETTHHIISGCPILAKKEYLDRHNKVAKQLHWNLCKHYNVKVKDKWYEHEPDPVVNTSEVTLIWDEKIYTDRKMKAIKPDLLLKDKTTQQCLIIDVAVPSDYNITQKEAEKKLKYKDLQIEIERMWNMKVKIVPIIIGATGFISKATANIIKEVPGKHNLLTMQKAVVLSTAHILRKVL